MDVILLTVLQKLKNAVVCNLSLRITSVRATGGIPAATGQKKITFLSANLAEIVIRLNKNADIRMSVIKVTTVLTWLLAIKKLCLINLVGKREPVLIVTQSI